VIIMVVLIGIGLRRQRMAEGFSRAIASSSRSCDAGTNPAFGRPFFHTHSET
jgi:hypothetical protein